MLVFADRERRISPADHLRAIRAEIESGDQETLTDAFVRACELAQGLVDAEFHASGVDDLSPIHKASLALLLDLAQRLRAQTGGPFADPFAGLTLRTSVAVRTAEGFAHYAVYPEAFLAAGERLRATTVIGLRSIGAGLAALVAAACGAARLFSLRPVGDPYRRRLSVAPALEAALLAEPQGLFAVVDEGPGQSGSSLAAVASWLSERGVAAERILFVTSHAGEPGPAADHDIRAIWKATRRISVDFGAVFLREGAAEPLAEWFEDLTGPALAPLRDLSGGAWRRGREDAPTAYPMQERRKFLLRTARGRYLLKFAGLGPGPRRKFARARALHRAGLSPEPLAFRRGFLLERWLDAPPAQARAGDLAQVGAYLGFRATHFPAATRGASLDELADMAEHNLGRALNRRRLAALQREARPVEVDGRLHVWEWLRVGNRLVKTDALDHADGHDVVGPQDIAWDVAGAEIELGLDADRLVTALPAATRPSAPLVAFMRVAYVGFQQGLWTFAASSEPTDSRIAALLDRYAAQARATLEEIP